MLFPNSYNKQGIQSNLHSYTPMNQGPIFAKVYPEGIQPIKGNNCGLFPLGLWPFILLINVNVKLPTINGILTFMSSKKLHAQLS